MHSTFPIITTRWRTTLLIVGVCPLKDYVVDVIFTNHCEEPVMFESSSSSNRWAHFDLHTVAGSHLSQICKQVRVSLVKILTR